MLDLSAGRSAHEAGNPVSEGIWTVEEATRFLLADRLKQFVEGGSPLNETGTLYSDLLNSAMYEIDWHEVADAFLEE